jgi:hypothetical protein
MTKYEELSCWIADLQEVEEKLSWTELAEEHARLEKMIREAYANREISGAQGQRLLNALP